jgi:5-methylcytosine-specific restriction enzyme A
MRGPYLEAHYIQWQSQSGTDTINNTAALCENCHRKMYVLNLEADLAKLKRNNTVG